MPFSSYEDGFAGIARESGSRPMMMQAKAEQPTAGTTRCIRYKLPGRVK